VESFPLLKYLFQVYLSQLPSDSMFSILLDLGTATCMELFARIGMVKVDKV